MAEVIGQQKGASKKRFVNLNSLMNWF